MRSPDKETYQQAAGIVAAGGVIAFRTDTFYGLGADPLDAEAVNKIWELKGREQGKPILLLISDLSQVERFVASRSSLFDESTRRYWPGPLTLVSNARKGLPEQLTAGTGTIGLRLPDDQRVRDLVRLCGGALTATSANPSGRSPARSAKEVSAYFPVGVDLIVDDGEVTSSEASTVLDVVGDQPRVIREGRLSRKDLSGLFD